MMAEITYEQMFDILRREKSREELQELPLDFFEAAEDYLRDRKAMTQGESLAAQRARIEEQNVRKILNELYDRREWKIITLATHSTRTDATLIDTDTLLPRERELFDELVGLLERKRKEILSTARPITVKRPPTPKIMKEEPAQGEVAITDAESSEEGLKVKFLSPVPKFVGKNLEVFGPFQEGDETRLPDDVAQILIRKGRAKVNTS